MAAHGLEGQVHVGPQRLRPGVLLDVELLVARLEERADDGVPEVTDRGLAPVDDRLVQQAVEVVHVAVLHLPPDLLQLREGLERLGGVLRPAGHQATPHLGLELLPAHTRHERAAVGQADQLQQSPVQFQELRPGEAPLGQEADGVGNEPFEEAVDDRGLVVEEVDVLRGLGPLPGLDGIDRPGVGGDGVRFPGCVRANPPAEGLGVLQHPRRGDLRFGHLRDFGQQFADPARCVLDHGCPPSCGESFLVDSRSLKSAGGLRYGALANLGAQQSGRPLARRAEPRCGAGATGLLSGHR